MYLLDEPFSALDNSTASQVIDALKGEEYKDKTFLVATNRAWHVKFADRVVKLENGSIIFNGTKEEFLQREGIKPEELQVHFKKFNFRLITMVQIQTLIKKNRINQMQKWRQKVPKMI